MNEATGLMKRGRFLEALDCLREHPPSRHDPAYEKHQVLFAEALQLTGRNIEGERLCKDLCDRPGISASILARCHVILGNISRDRGASPDSSQHFEKAMSLAKKADDREVASWVSLRFLAALAEDTWTETATGAIAEVRKQVSRSGDPIAIAALHLSLAKLEGTRGLVLAAHRHLQGGKSLLEKHSSVCLEGIAAINEACLAFLGSDTDSAFAHASAAIKSADISGHMATRRAACANLAHIHLTRGQFREADKCFREALTSCEKGGTHEIALLDGLAQLELARGN